MLKYLFVFFTLLVTLVRALPPYATKNAAISYAAPIKVSTPLGYEASALGEYGSAILLSPQYSVPNVVQAAIQTKHHVHHYEVPSTGYIQPTTVEVNTKSVPIHIIFRSSSSHLNVQQLHEGSPGTVQESSSQDEPHRLVHSVTKPIIQEIREIIVPMRRITQEITPVQEEVQTVVARDEQKPTLVAAPAPITASAPALAPVAVLAPTVSDPVSALIKSTPLTSYSPVLAKTKY